LAAVVTRAVKAQPERYFGIFRRTLLPLTVSAIAICGLAAGGDALIEKISVARLPAAAAGSPNVLLIVLDTFRGDRMGAYGYSRPTTPFLDEYAKKSILFEHAFANSSWTLPSHASLFTGRLPYEHGATINRLDTRFPTIGEVLASRGYLTAGFVGNKTSCTKAFGLARGFQRWENIFTDFYDSIRRTSLGRRLERYAQKYLRLGAPPFRTPAPEINRHVLDWLDARAQRPFFVFVNYMETHDPYVAPPQFVQRFRTLNDDEALPVTGRTLQAPDQGVTDSYDSAVAYLDSEVSKLFQGLAQRGLDKNMLVIITSDHGESLGENGLHTHQNSLYLPQIRVPLLVRFPGHTAENMRVAGVVGLERIAPTIAELSLGFTEPFTTGSLRPMWSGPAEATEPVLSEIAGDDWPGVPEHWPIRQGWLKSLITDRWHFI
ncbi:MAG: sulfatase, partial [Gammaproteobacteria bacterium]